MKPIAEKGAVRHVPEDAFAVCSMGPVFHAGGGTGGGGGIAQVGDIIVHVGSGGTGAPDRRVVVESPLSGDFARNQRYARWAMLDCLQRGEAPFASHLLYTQMLDDRQPEQREAGIQAGFAWAAGVRRVYYVDLCRVEDSTGMSRAWDLSPGELRTLPAIMWVAFMQGKEPKGT